MGADGSFFARLTRPGCCRVIDFSDTAPTFLLRLEIQQLGQLTRIDAITLVVIFQQGIPARIAHHRFRVL